ncbi:MAG: M28 family peptidase [Bacteroidales bacterium]|jgi:hypothetical protein|nr:M28 family peptidase [Bacteroidales bacterium]
MKTHIISILFLLVPIVVFGQDKTALHYASLIDSSNMKVTLARLASDEFEGRGTGEKGGELTVSYISEYLKDKKIPAGNNGSYIQNIGAKVREKGNKCFFLDNFDYQEDYSYENMIMHDTIISSDHLLFVGYGVYSATYNDFESVDISGKVIMMLNDQPVNKFGLNYAIHPKSEDYLTAKRPKVIIRVRQDFRTYSSHSYKQILFRDEKESIPELFVNERLANKILEPTGKTVKQIAYEVEKTGAPPSVKIDKTVIFNGNNRYLDAKANNVIGFIEGSDLKDEYVVISAHHDHDGKPYNTVYNGADDNASGVSSVLEIASVLAKAKKEGKGPRRSVIILFPAAEEKGLYGSQYYAEHPLYPLEKTIACVNIDMVGRVSYDYETRDNNYVYLVNHKTMSGNLTGLVEEINKNSLRLTLDYTYTSPGDIQRYFSRSDQYNFAQKGVPSIMFTSGEHKDYHKPTDDYELIDFNGAWKRTRLAFLLIWELANADKERFEAKKRAVIQDEILIESY